MIESDILTRLKEWGLDDLAIERLGIYADGVDKAPMNLTAFSPREFWIKGVFDALSLLPLIEKQLPSVAVSAVDVGSGSGLPGMVLAIARPGWRWTLVDSRMKRAEFLREVVAWLGLANVSVECTRAEEWVRGDPSLRDRFTLVTARAVAPIRTTLELTLPLCRVGGAAVIPLGESGYRDLETMEPFLKRLGGQTLPLTQPWIAVIQKVGRTAEDYPRTGSKLGQA